MSIRTIIALDVMTPETPHPADAVRIVAAEGRHDEFVRRLSAEVFSHFGDYATWLPQMMRGPWNVTVVAVAGSEPVGFAIYSFERLNARIVDLAAIAIVPAWQRRAVGTRLLAHAENVTRRMFPGRPSEIELTVADENAAARGLFERAGFVAVPGSEGRYPLGQKSQAMRKTFDA